MNKLSFTEFAETIRLYWKINEKYDKNGEKLTNKELSALYDKFSQSSCGQGHLSVMIDYCNARGEFTYSVYSTILDNIKSILASNINRFVFVTCKCGKVTTIHTADLFLTTGRYVDCPGRKDGTCNFSYEYRLLRANLLNNKGWMFVA